MHSAPSAAAPTIDRSSHDHRGGADPGRLPGPLRQRRRDRVHEPAVRVVQVGGQGRDEVPVLLDHRLRHAPIVQVFEYRG